MNKVRYPNGSEVNFESFIDDLQDKAFTNLLRRTQTLIDGYGLALTVTNGEIGSEFQTSVISDGAEISVASGRGLTVSGEYLRISTPLTTDNLADTNANIGYAVVLTYNEVGSQSTKAMNAFVFDKLGGESLNRKTRFSDSVSISLVEVETTISNLRNSLTDDQIAVAVVYDATGTFDVESAGLEGYNDQSFGDFSVIDIRSDERLLFSNRLISDGVVLFKDRPSVGPNAFAQNIEFTQDLSVSGSFTLKTDIDFSVVPEDSEVSISSPSGEHLKFYEENDEPRTRVSNLFADELRVNKGTTEQPIWEDVLSTGRVPTKPNNLRIFDIYPTTAKEEKAGYVQVKWNWDGLIVTDTDGNTVDISDTSYFNEEIDFTPEQQENLKEKLIFFPKLGSKFRILDVESISNGWKFTLEDFDDNLPGHDDPTSESQDGRIIDRNLDHYQLVFRSSPTQGKPANEQIYAELEESHIENPTYVQKLELERSWFFTLRGITDIGVKTSTVIMPAGEYDPSRGEDPNADLIEYGSPFKMRLPNIFPSGNFELTADKQGFSIQINGWEASDDPLNTAHEFEILWSRRVILTESNFEDYENAERLVTPARDDIHISSAVPTRYSVAIRPIQNKRPVGPPVFDTIVSGGGGVSPEEQILFEDKITIENMRGVVTDRWNERTDQETFTYFRHYLSSGLTGEPVNTRFEDVHGKKAVWVNQGSNEINVANFTESNSTGGDIETNIVTSPSVATDAKRLEFLTPGTNSTEGIEDSLEDWAKIETNEISISPNEVVVFECTAVHLNHYRSRINVQLVDSNNNVLTEKQTFKVFGDFGSAFGGLRRTFFLSYKNTSIDVLDVKAVIRGWINPDLPEGSPEGIDDVGISILIEDQNTPDIPKITDPYEVSFSMHALPLSLKKDAAITDSSVRTSIEKMDITRAFSMGEDVSYYTSRFKSPPVSAGKGTEFVVGVDKAGRFISQKHLEVDYEITGLEFTPYLAEGVSSQSPALIRVYPKHVDDAAVKLPIEFASDTAIEKETSLEIKTNQGERGMVIDAFDPDGGNNYSQISGHLIVKGKPVIIDTLGSN